LVPAWMAPSQWGTGIQFTPPKKALDSFWAPYISDILMFTISDILMFG
jgi:hypothetical protein